VWFFAIILGALPSPMMFYTIGGLLGVFHSMIVANMGCVSNHLYPARDIEYAFAYQEAFGGIGSLIGTYTAGLIQAAHNQSYGNYMGTQVACGGCLLIFFLLSGEKPGRHTMTRRLRIHKILTHYNHLNPWYRHKSILK